MYFFIWPISIFSQPWTPMPQLCSCTYASNHLTMNTWGVFEILMCLVPQVTGLANIFWSTLILLTQRLNSIRKTKWISINILYTLIYCLSWLPLFMVYWCPCTLSISATAHLKDRRYHFLRNVAFSQNLEQKSRYSAFSVVAQVTKKYAYF
jgi:hypothetical protein